MEMILGAIESSSSLPVSIAEYLDESVRAQTTPSLLLWGWDWPRGCRCLRAAHLCQIFLFSLVLQWMRPHFGTWIQVCKLWGDGSMRDWHCVVLPITSILWFWHIILEPSMCAQFFFSLIFFVSSYFGGRREWRLVCWFAFPSVRGFTGNFDLNY